MEKRSARSKVFRAGGGAAASAVVANTLIYAAASAAGAGFQVSSGASTTTVALAQVVGTSAIAVLAGTLVAVAVGLPRLRGLEVAAVLFTLMSLGGPLSMGAGTTTKVSLAAMHVLAAGSWLVWLRRASVGESAIPSRAAGQSALA